MIRTLSIALVLAAGVALAQDGVSVPPDPALACETTVAEIPGYRLVWHDEFDVDGEPDASKWSFEHGFRRNNELQWYRKENATCRNGLLVIEGRRERVKNPDYDPNSGDWRKKREYAEYTSASLNTWGRSAWRLSESILVVRARLTITEGYFPAIWTTGPGQWPHGGEVDLMEYYRGRILANFAWGTKQQWNARWHAFQNPNHGDQNKPRIEYFTGRDPDWLQKFHLWKLVGSDEKTHILLDGELLNEVSHETARNPETEWSTVVHPFRESHALILNLAIGGPGGDPSAAGFPMVYEVDYARVYRRE
ncbi:MAG: glycoside hydrolase family 16 protein [Lentisphaeria bacterium]|nr:glycoside hydrolase family 16 protein [Lentisphaeria bacterium]